VKATGRGRESVLKDAEREMPLAAQLGEGEPHRQQAVDEVLLVRAEVGRAQADVRDQLLDNVSIGPGRGEEQVRGNAVEGRLGEVLPAEGVERARVADISYRCTKSGGRVRAGRTDVVRRVDDQLSGQAAGVLAEEVTDRASRDREQHDVRTVQRSGDVDL